ncbi:MAG: hypothetical protein NW214_15665 [Pseudanabaenaceae cyanobacterium bins.39]|nr:hypothetical protein [Pseudanabaenaceae cyanobacterium bins.39]
MRKTYYQELCENTPPPLSSSPLGSKPVNLEKRKIEARKLSQLMTEKRPFCFLRIGDMDLAYLLAAQEGKSVEFNDNESTVGGTLASGTPGISQQYATRLYNALTLGDYVDFHERLYPMEHWLPRLQLPRSQYLHRNPDRETSYLSLTWLEFEFKHYCNSRRIGIAGAEAKLLELLTKQVAWQKESEPFWPSKSEIYFHQVREDGRNLDKNLDLIKKDLSDFIDFNQIDTLFLSLGGGAKILCYELSREHNICTFDFGAMLRALTYSACDGNRSTRSNHSPFLFRVPFNIYMSAIQEAFPSLSNEEILAKAHAQVILELLSKEVGWSCSYWEYNFSKDNYFYFSQSYQSYLKNYRYLAYTSSTTKKELKSFLYFCGVNSLTIEGRVYYFIFRIKAKLQELLCKLKQYKYFNNN